MRRHAKDGRLERRARKPNPASRGKKQYRSPQLVVYGDLRRLTMAGKAGTSNDGTGKPKSKAG